MTEPLITRRPNRYVVMPCRTETSTGHVQRWYGILDTMISDTHITNAPAWCSLDGTERLEWPDVPNAMRWLNACREQREREGGPAWYLPSGWYGPGFERRADTRASVDPWADLPSDSPLVHA